MTTIGIKEAFAGYKATLLNVQWSVSAWNPAGELVVSLWAHHRRKKSLPGYLEFEGSANRWKGPGNTEFRKNVARAFTTAAVVRLVIADTIEVGRVEAGEDGSKIKKDFHLKEEVVGRVTEWDGENYIFRFERATS